jgi:hypothetical protein
MSVRKVISADIYKAQGTIQGKIVSGIKEIYDDAQGMVFCADVDIGQPEVLKNVPIAVQNRDIFYSEQNKSVVLTKVNDQKWVISGISKMDLGRTHYIYMTFQDEVFQVTGDACDGYEFRPLTFGELGDLATTGFGELPFGVQGKFDLNGSLVEIMEV